MWPLSSPDTLKGRDENGFLVFRGLQQRREVCVHLKGLIGAAWGWRSVHSPQGGGSAFIQEAFSGDRVGKKRIPRRPVFNGRYEN